MSESDIHAPGPGSQPSPVGYPAHPAVALGATLEPFVRGRRVALLGDATTGLAELMAHRGARAVHVYDPENSRVAESLARSIGRDPRIGYAAFSEDLGTRDSAFDALIIPDLTAFTAPADVVRRARRLLSHGGVAVVASPNADVERRLLPRDPSRSAMLDYYELYDIVSIQFSHVRMLGQAPFVGYTVADFAPNGEPDVTVDTSLVPDAEQPEWFIAVASERRFELDPYVIVGLPMADVADATAPITEEPTTPRRAALHEDRAALAEAQTRLMVVSAELEKLREMRRTTRGTARVAISPTETQTLRLAELQRQSEETAANLKAAESRAGDEHVRAERLTHEAAELETELARQRDRGTRLTKLLEEERKARTKVDLELGMLRAADAASGRVTSGTAPSGVALGSMGLRGEAIRGETSIRNESEHLRARIEELEEEHMITQRPPPMEDQPTPHGADPHDPPTIERQLDILPQLQVLEQRIVELEGQLTHEKARLIQLRAERDAAVRERERLTRERKAALEERDSALESRKAALKERKEFEDANARARAERDAMKKQLDEGLAQRDALLAERDELLEARDALALDSEALEREHATLAKRVKELEQATAETQKSTGAEVEIVQLEERLRTRGHDVAKLRRDLEESERIGRELVLELEAFGAFGSGGGANGDAEPKDAAEAQARLDAMAESVAKREADLTAASWRISQLERELSVASRDASHAPDRVRRELEDALVAAQQELAQLRQALSSAVDSRELDSAVAEQAVLIHQLDGDSRRGDADG